MITQSPLSGRCDVVVAQFTEAADHRHIWVSALIPQSVWGNIPCWAGSSSPPRLAGGLRSAPRARMARVSSRPRSPRHEGSNNRSPRGAPTYCDPRSYSEAMRVVRTPGHDGAVRGDQRFTGSDGISSREGVRSSPPASEGFEQTRCMPCGQGAVSSTTYRPARDHRTVMSDVRATSRGCPSLISPVSETRRLGSSASRLSSPGSAWRSSHSARRSHRVERAVAELHDLGCADS